MNCHLRILVDQKALREGRRLGINTIAKESRASRSAIVRMLNNTIKNVPLDDLLLVCLYLNCTPGDVLRIEDKYIPDSD